MVANAKVWNPIDQTMYDAIIYEDYVNDYMCKVFGFFNRPVSLDYLRVVGFSIYPG